MGGYRYMMKRFLGILILAASATALHAESVWTGNAAVASASFVTGETNGYFAASNSFPSGTVLSVTNPKGGLSIDVTVVGRLETPGVFILLDQNAARALNLPVNQVVPVRVSPRVQNPLLPLVEEHSDSSAEDIDYNPAAGLPLVKQPASEPAKTVKDDSKTAAKPIAKLSEPVIIESYTLNDTLTDERVDPPDDGEADVEADTVTSEPSFVAVTPALPDTSVTDSGFPADSEKYIYFLSPSDLSPPVGDTDLPEPNEEVMDEEPYRYRLPIVTPEPGSRYVQIGAYRNKAVLEDATIAVQKTHSAYPIAVALEERSGTTVYKLLIGPLRPAETGIVLQTARSTLFPDAFQYSP